MTLKSLLGVLGFQVVWLVCAYGAANGSSSAGIAAAIIYVAIHLWSRGFAASDCVVILVSAALGLVCESTLIRSGFIKYATGEFASGFAPAWTVALWAAFGCTIGNLSSLLGQRSRFAGPALGAICGPLAYMAGARIGALAIDESSGVRVLATSMIWAVVLPVLVAVHRSLSSRQVGSQVEPIRNK